MVALLKEMSGKHGGHVHFAACLLRIDVVADKLSRDGGWTNVKRPGVSKRVGNFIGQREAEKLHADVAIHVLQRQNRNRVLRRATAHQLMLPEPHRSNRDQNRDQQRAHSQQNIR